MEVYKLRDNTIVTLPQITILNGSHVFLNPSNMQESGYYPIEYDEITKYERYFDYEQRGNFINNVYVISEVAIEKNINSVKNIMLEDINAKTNAMLSHAVAKYSAAEMAAWSDLENDARKFKDGSQPEECPTLLLEATLCKQTLDELADEVIGNADQLKQYRAYCVSSRFLRSKHIRENINTINQCRRYEYLPVQIEPTESTIDYPVTSDKIAIHPINGYKFVSSSDTDEMHVYNSDNILENTLIIKHPIKSMCFNADGSLFMIGAGETGLYVYTVEFDNIITLLGIKTDINSFDVVYSHGTNTVISIDNTGPISILDVRVLENTLATKENIVIANDKIIKSTCLTTDGLLNILQEDGNLYLLDIIGDGSKSNDVIETTGNFIFCTQTLLYVVELDTIKIFTSDDQNGLTELFTYTVAGEILNTKAIEVDGKVRLYVLQTVDGVLGLTDLSFNLTSCELTETIEYIVDQDSKGIYIDESRKLLYITNPQKPYLVFDLGNHDIKTTNEIPIGVDEIETSNNIITELNVISTRKEAIETWPLNIKYVNMLLDW